MDSSGFAEAMWEDKISRTRHIPLVFCGMSKMVKDVLCIIRQTQILKVCDTRESALDAIRKGLIT